MVCYHIIMRKGGKDEESANNNNVSIHEVITKDVEGGGGEGCFNLP